MDPRTRLLMYKMVSAGTLERINGCISTGKESVVFHANGGMYVSRETAFISPMSSILVCVN